MKIRIGIPYPNHGSISSTTRMCLECLHAVKDAELTWISARTSIISEGRCGLVSMGDNRIGQVVKDFDYFLSLDADMGFQPGDIMRLVNLNLPIVSGAYRNRLFPDHMNAGSFTKYGTVDSTGMFPFPMYPAGLVECSWVGAGFLLIHVDVFNKIKYPWFSCYAHEFTDSENQQRVVFHHDDISFCVKAQTAGYKIFVDTETVVDHLL